VTLPMPASLEARTALTTRLRRAPRLVELDAGPLSLTRALAALAHQSGLAVPAKLVATAAGDAGMLIEITGGPDDASRAYLALEAALAWIDGRDGRPMIPGEPAALEEALRAVGWSSESVGRGRLRLHVPAEVTSMRVVVEPLADGAVVVSTPPTPVRVAGARAARAVRLFTLEANARLRLVRLGAKEERDGMLVVQRDVVLADGTDLTRWIVEAVHALAVAHALTAGALRALGTDSVADAYLAFRERWS